jgi:hypothetical protein
MPLLIRFTAIAFGLGAFFGTIWAIATNRQARTWPVTEGLIVHSALRIASDPREGGTSADIAYEFTVGTDKYRSSRITVAPTLHTEAYKARLLQLFPQGARVAVRYNPRKPSFSVLQTEVSALWPLGMLAGLGAAAAGVFAP